MRFKSSFIVFSAPSGAGKTTIVKRLAQKYNQLAISISATTRKKRENEVDGREYYFLDKDRFLKAIQEGKFIEYEEVHSDYYGTLRETVDQLLSQGKCILFDIDVNGAKSIKKYYPEAILIFIKPPSKEELIERLKNRKESEQSINHRLQRLAYEYDEAQHFDHIVVNDDLEKAIARVEHIILENT